VGSLEFSTPSYPPIKHLPSALFFYVASRFSHHSRRHWKGAPPNLSSFASLPLFKFQVSSKPCVWLFHLFSFESLASFKNKRRTEKSEEENSYFLLLLLLLHFVFSQKNLQHFEARDFLLTEKRMRFKKSIVFFP
jgi:hypothetical protein